MFGLRVGASQPWLWLLVTALVIVTLWQLHQQQWLIWRPHIYSCAHENGFCTIFIPEDPTLKFLDPVLAARVVSDAGVIKAESAVIYHNVESPLYAVTFRPLGNRQHFVHLRLEYADRLHSLTDPPTSENGTPPTSETALDYESYLGEPIKGSPFLVNVNSGDIVHLRGTEAQCSCTYCEGYWAMQAETRQSYFGYTPLVCPSACNQVLLELTESQFRSLFIHMKVTDKSQPVWRSFDCQYPELTHDALWSFLKRWRVYMIGDSVNRQMFETVVKRFPTAVEYNWEELDSNNPAEHQRKTELWRRVVPVHEKDAFPNKKSVTILANSSCLTRVVKCTTRRNPLKVEATKLTNRTIFRQLETLIERWPLANERDIILVNFGLHDVAFSKIDDYSVLLHNILYKIVKAGAARVIWRTTTAVHPNVIKPDILPQHRYFTNTRVKAFNDRAFEVIRRLNFDIAAGKMGEVFFSCRIYLPYATARDKIAILDLYALTETREDALQRHDMRHYNEDIYLTYWTLLLQQIEDNH